MTTYREHAMRCLAAAVMFTMLGAAQTVHAEDVQSSLFVVHFSTGPAWDDALEPGQQRGFAEHSANLQRQRAEGRIVFGARYAEYGMLVVHAATTGDVEELFSADPGVLAGIFVFSVQPLKVFFPWRDAGTGTN